MRNEVAPAVAPAIAPARSLGIWRSWAFVVGGTIGSAIFMMPAVLVPYGGLGLLSWAAAAVGALCVAMTFASLARRVSTTGGPYSYAHAAFGDFGGFVVAWLYWIALWVACAAITIGFTAYLGALLPAVRASPVLSVGAGLLLVWTLVGVNIAGVRQSGIVGLVTTLLKLSPLVVIGTAGLWFVDRTTLPPMNPGTGSSLVLFASAFTLTFWTFGGLESITVPSEDVIDPARTIPRALVTGTATVAVIYLLVTFVVSGVVPAAELRASAAPLAEAGVRMGGYWGGIAVTLGALVSTLGCLNANLLAVSQAAMAAARDGVFPHQLDRLTARHTPGRSLVVVGLLISAMLVMNYTKGMVGAYTFMLLLATLALVVPYAFSALAALVLEARAPEANTWRRAREAAVAMVAFAVCIWVIAAAGQETVYWGFLLLMAGLPVYVLMARRREALAALAAARHPEA